LGRQSIAYRATPKTSCAADPIGSTPSIANQNHPGR
jgi:hypothetical protein